MTTEQKLKVLEIGSKVSDLNKELLLMVAEINDKQDVPFPEGKELLRASHWLLDACIQINKAAQQ